MILKKTISGYFVKSVEEIKDLELKKNFTYIVLEILAIIEKKIENKRNG